MTELKSPVRRTVRRERHDLVVALYPNATIGIRELRGTEYFLPLETVYHQAIEAHRAAGKRKAKR